MPQPQTKISQLRALMASNQWDAALCFAAKFQQLGTQANAIRRAADALKHPAFYQQMGRDLEAIRRTGIAALNERFEERTPRAPKSGGLPTAPASALAAHQ